MANHVFKRGKGIPDKRLMHPRREWGIGLLIFGAILIAGSILSAQSFSQFRGLETSDGDAGVTIPRYNQSEIDAVLTEYQQREINFKALIADRSLVPTTDTATSSDETASSSEALSEEDGVEINVDTELVL